MRYTLLLRSRALFLVYERRNLSAMCNEARASARTGGRSWSRNFVNPKYFFFCLSRSHSTLFSLFLLLFSFVSNQSCVLEICRINVSTFFITFFYLSSVVLFSLDIPLSSQNYSVFSPSLSLLLCVCALRWFLKETLEGKKSPRESIWGDSSRLLGTRVRMRTTTILTRKMANDETNLIIIIFSKKRRRFRR